MSWRDSYYSSYPRALSYSAAGEHRVGSYIREIMTIPSLVSSSRPLAPRTPPPSTPLSLSNAVHYTVVPDCDEVYPGLYVGDAVAAKDKAYLRRIGFTHILNTAEGRRYTQVDTDHLFYRDCPTIKYMGFQLMDLPTTDISKYFYVAANFINDALNSGGRVLVHCLMGVSRSATCALAFLMIHRGMTLEEALRGVRRRRDIHPNTGFLKQLKWLENDLKKEREIR